MAQRIDLRNPHRIGK